MVRRRKTNRGAASAPATQRGGRRGATSSRGRGTRQMSEALVEDVLPSTEDTVESKKDTDDMEAEIHEKMKETEAPNSRNNTQCKLSDYAKDKTDVREEIGDGHSTDKPEEGRLTDTKKRPIDSGEKV